MAAQDQTAITTGPSNIIPPPPPGFVPVDETQAVPAERSRSSSLPDNIPPPPPGFVPVEEAPQTLQTKGLSLPSNMSIAPSQPSVWERVKNVFTSGIPQFSNRTVYDPKYGSEQFITPEAGLSPLQQEAHPIITGASEVAGSLTSPANIAIIGASGGLGSLPGAAGRIGARLLSAGFSGQMLYGAYQQIPEVKKALDAGDYSSAERLLTRIVLQGGLATLGLKHAATGAKAPVAEPSTPQGIIESQGLVYKGELSPGSDVHQFEDPNSPGKTAALKGKDISPDAVREKMQSKLQEFEERPIPQDSPLRQVLGGQDAPDVRLTDSTAAKNQLVAQDTVAEPKALRVFHGTTANVEDISKLDATLSRDGAAGRGIYLTDRPEQASAYAGPGEVGTGGRVLGGIPGRGRAALEWE